MVFRAAYGSAVKPGDIRWQEMDVQDALAFALFTDSHSDHKAGSSVGSVRDLIKEYNHFKNGNS